MSRLTALMLLLGLVTPPVSAAPAPPVTIYRCTDASGHLTLRDSPCKRGERRDVRTMLRPTDPPPSRAVSMRGREPTAAAPMTQVVYRTAPRPVYECITPDGERYTSASAEGDPRWVPLWTLGYPAVDIAPPMVEGGYGARIDRRSGGTRVRVDAGRRWRYPGYGYGVPVATAGGTWVRDACAPLPATEACAQLRDRREALDRRWFSALQGDRDAIEREQRRIDAELGESCP